MVDGGYEAQSHKPGHKKMSASWGSEFIIWFSQMTFQKGQSYLLLKYRLERTLIERNSFAHELHQAGAAGSYIMLVQK